MSVSDIRSVRTMQSHCILPLDIISVCNLDCDLKVVPVIYPVYWIFWGMRKCENLSLVSLCYAIHMSWFLCSACYFILEQKKKNKMGRKNPHNLEICVCYQLMCFTVWIHIRLMVGYCKEKCIAVNSAHQNTSVLI